VFDTGEAIGLWKADDSAAGQGEHERIEVPEEEEGQQHAERAESYGDRA
jgi:hypothetical protein